MWLPWGMGGREEGRGELLRFQITKWKRNFSTGLDSKDILSCWDPRPTWHITVELKQHPFELLVKILLCFS